MSTVHIPAVAYTVCDRCKQTSKDAPGMFRMNGQIRVVRGAMDYSGGIVGEVKSQHDLCDNCVMLAEVAVETFMKAPTP